VEQSGSAESMCAVFHFVFAVVVAVLVVGSAAKPLSGQRQNPRRCPSDPPFYKRGIASPCHSACSGAEAQNLWVPFSTLSLSCSLSASPPAPKGATAKSPSEPIRLPLFTKGEFELVILRERAESIGAVFHFVVVFPSPLAGEGVSQSETR
jgi:hypothetical protein